jgi:hypothetical protein
LSSTARAIFGKSKIRRQTGLFNGEGGPSYREAKGGDIQPQPFWQARYYDFNAWSEQKRVEKLRYIHRNPWQSRTCALGGTDSGRD